MLRISDAKTESYQNQQRNLPVDMDLIDILWRQDMDLGVTRDMFDTSRRQLEKEVKGKEVNETVEVEQSADLQNITFNPQLVPVNQSTNYAVDNETGELIPVTPITADDMLELWQQINGLPDNNTQTFQTNDLAALDNLTNQADTFDSLLDEYGFQYTPERSNTEFQSAKLEDEPVPDQLQSEGLEEESWEDILSLLSEQANLTSYVNDASTQQSYDQDTSLDLLNITPTVGQSTDRNSVLFNDDSRLLALQNPDLWNVSVDSASGNEQFLMNNVSLAQTIPITFTAPSLLNDSISSINNNFTVSPEPLLQAQESSTNFTNATLDLLSPIFSLNQTSTPFTNLTALLTNTYTNATFSDNDVKVSQQQNEAAAADRAMLNMSQPMTLAPYANNDTFIQQLLQNDLTDLAFDDGADDDSAATGYDGLHENWSTDSAVSSMHSSNQAYGGSSSYLDEGSMDGMEELEGATGGSPKNEVKYSDTLAYQYNIDHRRFHSFSSNTSLSSNSSQLEYDVAKPLQKHVAHNHTYYLQPGQKSREQKEEEARREKEERATRCKDAKRAQMLKIPFSVEDIIDLPVEQFTELLSRYTLTDAQHQLIRDIRRRGKNKAAAQNCRKRKLEVIQGLEDEVEGLRVERDKLHHNKQKLAADMMMMKEKFARLQADMLRSLRDPSGAPYDPELFMLQRTSDGDIILVPRTRQNGASASVRPENIHDNGEPQKRKNKRKE